MLLRPSLKKKYCDSSRRQYPGAEYMNSPNKIQAFAKKFSNNKHAKYGLPFLLFIVTGAVGLREFTNIRYEFSKGKWFTYDEVEAMGIKIRKPGEVTLQSEFEKIKNIDINNWENKRGPRPWEENLDVK